MGALIVLLVLLVQQARVDATTIAATQIGGGEGQQRELRERLEDAQWQRELLEKSRAEKSDELTQARARVAHLEEHTQRLEAQARELLERARAIDEGKKLRAEDLAAARAEADRLKKEIEQKKKELEQAKKQKGDGQEWYALIPYDGRSGTRRRPIYVECTEFGVLIQPEGLLLKAEDFNGPLGPGNPLDSALRAIRDHWERTAGNKAGQPYPLLVVRPSGVVAFGAAKAAIRAWDDEWGYELISDDKQLDFGPPDPALDQVLYKTVAVARQRQAAMVAMMPRRFQDDEPLKSFTPEPSIHTAGGRVVGGAGAGLGSGGGTGGGIGNSRGGPGGAGAGNGGVGNSGVGSSGGGSATGFGGTGLQGGPGNGIAGINGNSGVGNGTASGFGGGATGSGNQGYGSGQRGGAGPGGNSSNSGAWTASTPNGGPASGSPGSGGAGSGGIGSANAGSGGLPSVASGAGGSNGSSQRIGFSNSLGTSGTASGSGASGEAFPYSQTNGSGTGNSGYGQAGAGGQTGDGSALGSAGGSAYAGGTNGGRPGGSGGAASGGQPGGSSGAPGTEFAGTSGGGSSAMGGSSSMSGGSSQPGGSPFGGSSMSSAGSQGGMGIPSLTFGQTKPPASGSSSGSSSNGSSSGGTPKSTAKRGNNWALPQAKPHETGVTRPLRVSIEPDRVVLVPERGDDRRPQVVKIAPDLSLEDVNHVVSAVQSEVKGWGLAVANGYWKPVLQAEVAPGAEQHFANLQMALKGSGIDIIRR
jgi:hypothetical protein